ncbi:hypothetical protein GQX73_g10580 [Xylaria multiplex]|uniref:Lipocalin-like domain-containing protein n=1 Tax=Xylaria multiplex TaxID=323545 RepID=A0A7C8MJK5_9PEZI|nr:hypothetical protein GQX73_g10580 [Xylaria multiplex]
MRGTLSAISLCAIGASAVALPAATEVEARQESAGTWYMVGFQPNCGSSFGCNSDYAIFGAPDAVPGAPAFALRCNTWGSCTNTLPGDATASITINQGPLKITQTFTSGGKKFTASASVNWNGNTLASFTIPVTVTSA